MESQNNVQIQFLGAAGTVTGSKHLLTLGSHKILIDCGLFQGEDEKLLNARPLGVNPADIDCVLLTHAHLDHTGYLPSLVKQGFSGSIYGTVPTLEIAEIILEDSAKIAEEEEKRFSNKKKGRPGSSGKRERMSSAGNQTYNMKEAELTVRRFSPIEQGEWIALYTDVNIRFRYSGHIIGATFIEIRYEGKWIVFSGDIGREDDFLLYPPQKPEHADILVIESTYGDRTHPDDAKDQLAASIKEAALRNGTVIIPSFAVERMQLLMYLLWQMKVANSIPDLPVYVDSPMGKNVLEVFQSNSEWHKLPPDQCAKMCDSIKINKNIEETYATIDNKRPKIIIAGSGMVTGGRVLTYLQYYIQNPSTTILLVGFQANGTNGRLLQEGAKELLIRENLCEVKATVKTINGLSGHADQTELLGWMSNLKEKPKNIYIVHGEPEASQVLKGKIEEQYGITAEIASLGQSVFLT